MNDTRIAWAGMTWNPVTGCSAAGSELPSRGCENCYARRMAARFKGRAGFPLERDGFAPTFHPDRLDAPRLRHRKTRVFACSMGDLFHDDVRPEWLTRSWINMSFAFWHSFVVLTKRPGRMRDFVANCWRDHRIGDTAACGAHLWLGTSVCEQLDAERFMPALAETPVSSVRGRPQRVVSCEPLVGPVDLSPWLDRTGLVIVGGESGSGARPMDRAWALDLVKQCRSAKVPVFVKQMSACEGKAFRDFASFPDGLRVRETPDGLVPCGS